MTEREQAVLQLVIEDVVETGQPVGSRYLVEKYRLPMSPATLRNVFAILEKDGYLTHQHTSAGRIPTEKGYRFYLQGLMHVRDLRRRESLALHEAARSLNRFAHALSTLTESAFVMLNNVSHTPFSTGFTQLLSQPEFSNHESVLRLTAVLDDLEQAFRGVEGHIRHEPVAFIGRECPFGEECGSVIMRVGDHTLVSLVGPIRMNYARAYAALKGAQDYLESYEG